jgi:hypothetical protein
MYKWDDTDEIWGNGRVKRLDEAVARLESFVHVDHCKSVGQRGGDEVFVKSFNRVTHGEFDEDDIKTTANWLQALATRAEDRYKHPPFHETPWAESVLQSAQNARDMAAEIRRVFYEKAPNLRPVGESTKP